MSFLIADEILGSKETLDQDLTEDISQHSVYCEVDWCDDPSVGLLHSNSDLREAIVMYGPLGIKCGVEWFNDCVVSALEHDSKDSVKVMPPGYRPLMNKWSVNWCDTAKYIVWQKPQK